MAGAGGWRKRLLRAAAGVIVVFVVVFGVIGAVAYHQRFEIIRWRAGLPAFSHDAGDASTLMVPMRDGVRLKTSVALPATTTTTTTTTTTDAASPTILIRNPYSLMTPLLHMVCGVFVRYGYACVLQSVRGQGGSEGLWEPLVNERNDGSDTLAWLVDQPFVDGNIGTMGPSYLGAVQWAVADIAPPEVKTMVPMVMGTDLHDAMYERGLFRHEVMTAWAALMPVPGMRIFSGSSAYAKALAHRPHKDADVAAIGLELPWYREWIQSPAIDDAYWQREDVKLLTSVPERVQRPMLLIGGFFDPFFEPQRRAFENLGSRAESVFIVTPTNHLGRVTGDFPIHIDDNERARASQTPWPLLLDWFGHHLRGEPLRLLQPGDVWVLSPTSARFRKTATWPEATKTTVLWPTASQALQPTTTTAPPSTLSWRADPSAPQAARGGASLLAFAFFPFNSTTPGPGLVSRGNEGTEGLTFRTAVLPTATTIRGAMRLDATVTSDATDAAVVARVSVEDEDGRAYLIREAAATLRFPRDEHRRPAPAPGTRVQVQLEFWPIEWTLHKGQRLRLDISSSSFPALHTHSNTDVPWADAVAGEVADIAFTVDDDATKLSVPLDPSPWP
jgi:putative CocE/NonD family hydrolase